MDDTFRRQWAIQLAQERAEQARAHRAYEDEPPAPRPLERSRWLGLQVRSLLALVVVAHGRAVLKLLDNAEAQLAELARRERGRRQAPSLWGVTRRPVES